MSKKKEIKKEDLEKVNGGRDKTELVAPFDIRENKLNPPLPINGPGGAKKWGEETNK